MKFLCLMFSLVSLLACTKKITLQAIHPAMTRVESTVTTISSGTVESEQQAILSFGINGRIAEVFRKAGDNVKTGDAIARIENTDIKLIYEQAEREHGRAKKLYSERLISKTSFEEAKKALEIAKSNWEKSIITAPFDGMITELNLNLGEMFNPQARRTPVRIVDNKARIIKGDIDEMDLSKVKIGQTARVRIPAVKAEAFSAKVTRVVPFVDATKEQDRVSQIEMKLESNEITIPVGASAEIEILTDYKDNALGVPNRLLLGTGKDRFVYKADNGALKKVPVKTGIGNYEKIEIVEGLHPKDLIVYPSEEAELKDGLRPIIKEVPWP